MPEATELSPQGFDILRRAVTCARDEQIKTVAVLRLRMQRDFPDQDADIDAALRFWANHAAATKSRNAQLA